MQAAIDDLANRLAELGDNRLLGFVDHVETTTGQQEGDKNQGNYNGRFHLAPPSIDLRNGSNGRALMFLSSIM